MKCERSNAIYRLRSRVLKPETLCLAKTLYQSESTVINLHQNFGWSEGFEGFLEAICQSGYATHSGSGPIFGVCCTQTTCSHLRDFIKPQIWGHIPSQVCRGPSRNPQIRSRLLFEVPSVNDIESKPFRTQWSPCPTGTVHWGTS
jgi:hypothetical protein